MNSSFEILRGVLCKTGNDGNSELAESRCASEELKSAFVNSIKSAPISNWSDDEHALVRTAILHDWQHQTLFQRVDENELFELLTMPYPDDASRMYMVTQTNLISNVTLRQRVAFYFFENDKSDAIRDAAFELLAKCRWDQSESYAQKWWNTQDTVKRIVALNVLRIYNSNLLTHYLEEAETSADNALMKAASGIRTLSKLGD